MTDQLTEEEIKELESHKDPLVKKLLEAYIETTLDPTKKLKSELRLTALYIADELRKARNEPILTGDDKVFERVALLLKENGKISAGLEDEEESEESAFIAKKSEKHRDKPVV